jgi:predicted ATPase
LHSKLSELKSKRLAHIGVLASAELDLKAVLETLLDIQEAKELIQEAALQCQASCQQKISQVVTRCLDTVFGVGVYRFALIFEQKRQQTEARAVLYDQEGNELADPINAVGGGCLDVVSFGLRLACLFLQRPRPSRVLVMDEPFKHVSVSCQGNVKTMLEELASDLGCQIILISHLPGLQDLDNRIEIK